MAKRSEANINPDLLKWARETAGYDLDSAAERLSKSRDVLAAWESGDRKPSISQARKAATVYNRSLASLYLAEVPEPLPAVEDFRRLPDAERVPYSPELRLLIRTVQNRQEWAREYRGSIGAEPLPFVGAWPRPRDPEVLGQRVREWLGVDTSHLRGLSRDDAFTYWYDSVETAGVFVVRERSVDPTEARGFALADDLAPFVFVNSEDSPGARIFTLLHEFCHLCIGGRSVSNLASSGSLPDREATVEQFCNAAASYALMPSIEVDRIVADPRHDVDAKLEAISATFKVSFEAAARRLLDLGLIDQHYYDQVRARGREEWRAFRARERQKQKNSGTGPARPMLVASRVGYSFAGAVLDAVGRGALGEADASTLLDSKLRHFDGISELVRRTNQRRSAE